MLWSRCHIAAPTLIVLAAVLFGCEGRQQQARPNTIRGPEFVESERTQLQETDSFFVARPNYLVVDRSDGSYFVVDVEQERVLRFGRRGDRQLAYGRPGSGPGELRAVGPVVIADSLVYVAARGNGRVEVFRRATAEHVRSYQWASYVGFMDVRGPQLLLGGIDPGTRTGLGILDLQTGASRRLIPLAAEYSAAPNLGRMFVAAFVMPVDSGFVVAYQGSNAVQLTDNDGRVVKSVRIPVRGRRPFPQDLARALASQNRPNWLRQFSPVYGARRLADGRIVLVHYSPEVQGRVLRATAFVSVLSPDLTRGCIDGELPTPADAMPVVGFRGDTLMVLTQDLVEGKPRTTIVGYVIRDESCEWMNLASQ